MKFKRNLGEFWKFVSDFGHLTVIILGLGVCTGCSQKESTLKVAVAANVQFAIREVEVAFEEKFAQDIDLIIGSSGKLTAQIQQGAPYDLLLSADIKYPESLVKSGHAATEPKIYGAGTLVLWTLYPKINLDKIPQILSQNSVQKIAIANPKNAPYGIAAMEVFDYFSLKKEINAKLIFAESVAQVNQYTLSKNCEVGFTAKSSVLSSKMKNKGRWIDLPKDSYQPINQGVIITRHGIENNQSLAQKFHDFLFSEKAQTILQNYGYETNN